MTYKDKYIRQLKFHYQTNKALINIAKAFKISADELYSKDYINHIDNSIATTKTMNTLIEKELLSIVNGKT